jgi:hypothetical protein
VLSLYPKPEANFIIPKRAFSDEEQWSDFRGIAVPHIGKRRCIIFTEDAEAILQFFLQSKKSKI